MSRKYSDREQWFLSRIGKILYRNNYCDCFLCKRIYEKGLLIKDENQAIYCCDMAVEFTMDGTPLRYFDTRDKMLEFEKSVSG